MKKIGKGNKKNQDKKFNTYILKYLQTIPLDDIAQLKEAVKDLPVDCKLETAGLDAKAYYICTDILVAYTDEGAWMSARTNNPTLKDNEMMLFDRKGRRIPNE